MGESSPKARPSANGLAPAGSSLRSPAPATFSRPHSQSNKANGASRTRTGDLLGAIQALSQLSYSPERRRLPHGPDSVAPPIAAPGRPNAAHSADPVGSGRYAP